MKTNHEISAHPLVIHQAIEWTGASGTTYRYYIWPRGAIIPGNPPGNFLHVKVAEDGTLAPAYIAQSDDLNKRLLTPGDRACIDASGATQLHVHISYKGEKERRAEEDDLVARWHPSCNLVLGPQHEAEKAAEAAMHLGA